MLKSAAEGRTLTLFSAMDAFCHCLFCDNLEECRWMCRKCRRLSIWETVWKMRRMV